SAWSASSVPKKATCNPNSTPLPHVLAGQWTAQYAPLSACWKYTTTPTRLRTPQKADSVQPNSSTASLWRKSYEENVGSLLLFPLRNRSSFAELLRLILCF